MKQIKKIRLMLADDHPIVIEGLNAGLSKYPEVDVVCTATVGKDVLGQIKKFNPDVILLDLGLPDISGIEVAKILKKESPDTKVIIYTMYNEPEYLKMLIPLGIKGFLLKESSIREVIKAITIVQQGGNYFSAKPLEKVFDSTANTGIPMPLANQNQNTDSTSTSSDEKHGLTLREKEILLLIAKGKKNKEIAEDLNANLRTIETHRRNIMLKLKIKTTAGLTKYVLENKL